jgi:putative transposase
MDNLLKDHRWPTHKLGCPIHDSFIVMSGVRPNFNCSNLRHTVSIDPGINLFPCQPPQALPSRSPHHFLTFSCYHRLPYLNDDHSRTIFLHTLEIIRRRHQFNVYGYVLMPEHVHLLLSEPKLHRLDNTLRALKGQSSKLLKGYRPQFWQIRYYDFNVFTNAKRIEKLKYIHRNPVARGLVEKPEDWPWSSFNHWATGETGLIEIESDWTFHRRERASTPEPPQIWVPHS